MDDRLRQADALGHALRVAANAVVAAPAQARPVEDLGDARRRSAALEARPAGVQLEQRRAGQPIVKAEVLGQVADPPAGLGIASSLSEQARLAAGRRNQAEQDLDRRRLAGAVGAQKAEDFTGLDGEVQPVQRDLAAVLLAESDRLDSCRRQWTARLSGDAPQVHRSEGAGHPVQVTVGVPDGGAADP